MKKTILVSLLLILVCISIYSQDLNVKIGGYFQYDKFPPEEKLYDNISLGLHFAGGGGLEFYYDWIAEYSNFFPAGRSHHPGLNVFVFKDLFLSGGMVIRESTAYKDKSLSLGPEGGLGYDLYVNNHFGIRTRLSLSYRYYKQNDIYNLRFSLVVFLKS